jgi:hypothetical protein
MIQACAGLDPMAVPVSRKRSCAKTNPKENPKEKSGHDPIQFDRIMVW